MSLWHCGHRWHWLITQTPVVFSFCFHWRGKYRLLFTRPLLRHVACVGQERVGEAATKDQPQELRKTQLFQRGKKNIFHSLFRVSFCTLFLILTK